MVCQFLFLPRHFSAEQEGFEKHIPQLENHLEQHLHPTYRNQTTLPWRWGELPSTSSRTGLVWQKTLISDRTRGLSVPARGRPFMEWGCPLVGCPQPPLNTQHTRGSPESTGMNRQATVMQGVQQGAPCPAAGYLGQLSRLGCVSCCKSHTTPFNTFLGQQAQKLEVFPGVFPLQYKLFLLSPRRSISSTKLTCT